MSRFRKQLSRSILAFIGIAMLVVVFGFSPDTAYAQQSDFGLQAVEDSGIGLSNQSIEVTIVKGIRILLGFLGLVAVIIVLYGGYTYMTAAGNEDNIARAKLILRNGVIGLVIILFSFIIVQFVITKLAGASGITDIGDKDPILTCANAADCSIPLCGDKFGAVSVTPKQPTTGMNNIVIRAVFTKPVATSASNVLEIKEGKKEVSNDFAYAFVPGTDNTVLEATYTLSDQCDTTDGYVEGHTCVVVPGEFQVRVKNDIVAVDGSGIEFGEQLCSDGSGLVNKVEFISDETKNDTRPPAIEEMGLLDSTTGIIYTDPEPTIFSGKTYTFTAKVEDTAAVEYGGVGYVEFVLSGEDEQDAVVYAGPSTNVESSKDPYTFEYSIPLSSQITTLFGAPKEYTITFTAWDIDHNSSVETYTFILKGGHCANGIQDGDETDVDVGGSCGGGNDDLCLKNSDCASGTCEDGYCVAQPEITDVNPMEGAIGNWVTVEGNYFGNEPGTIEFGLDDDWVPATLVQCGDVLEGPTWHNSYAIVEVPEFLQTIDTYSAEFSGGSLSTKEEVDIRAEGSIGTWVYINSETISNSTNHTVWSLGTPNNWLVLWYAVDTEKLVLWDDIQNTNTPIYVPNNEFSLDAWHHIVTTFGSDGTKTIYIDGNPVVSSKGSTFNTDDIAIKNFWLGERGEGLANYQLYGNIAEVAVYNTILSGSEIKDQYDIATTNPSLYQSIILNTNPIVYWTFDPENPTYQDDIYALEMNSVGTVDIVNKSILPPTTGDQASVAAIRITTADGTHSDTTVDAFGPKPGPNDGLYTYTDETLPGLCAVLVDGDQGEVLDKTNVGPPGTYIRAYGRGFNETQQQGDHISYKVNNTLTVDGEVFDWTARSIRTQVPINFSSGNPLVFAQIDGKDSNAIPFQVTAGDLSDVKPIITGIDPGDPTPGSFVTLFGDNFGIGGVVYITKDQDGASCVFNESNDQCIHLTQPPAPCLNTWTNTQIVVEIPEDFTDVDSYTVIVERNDNHFRSDGEDDVVSIQNGAPKPSICSFSPTQGPAPLPDDHNGLVFQGKNFTSAPILYFWNGSGDITDPTVVSDLNGDAWLGWNGTGDDRWDVNQEGTQIISSIAEEDSSSYPSMPMGKWPITIKANGVTGNSVQYFVTDCRTQKADSQGALKCCEEGTDTGSWKLLCEGESTEAGYVSRFTTGIFPNIPHVLIQCDEKNWDTKKYEGNNPSPIPSSEWEQSTDMCLNATAQVAFSIAIDPATVLSTSENVFVYECGESKSAINCEYDDTQLLTNLDLTYKPGQEPVLIIKNGDLSGAANYAPNTWYRVILTTGILSAPQDIGAGATSSMPLYISKSLPEGEAFNKGKVAFYYDFQTGSDFCTLNSAFITPKEKTVSKLGLIMDLWDIDMPFYYYLIGQADTKCTILDVDELGWNWASDRPERADIKVESDSDYVDTRAKATAFFHTPEGVELSAETSPSSTMATLFPPDGVIVANTSTLKVNLGKPEVIYYEPNCSEACPNGKILAKFNRHMDPGTFTQDNIILSKCTDPNCIGLDTVNYTFENADSLDPNDWLYVKITPEALELNTYYKVVLNDGVKSLGELIPGVEHQDGESLQNHEWVFRTKQDGTACAVDHVGVTPHPFIATYIGQKTKFTSTPYGAPNECSAYGQELNKFDEKYEYLWESTDVTVAAVTTFENTQTSVNYCTPACILSGSDVGYEKRDKPLCGNGIVEAGEDCDIAVNGEILGLTCTLECLRPGSDAKHCSNGSVDDGVPENTSFVGEMCDPTATTENGTSWAPYCTNTCTLKGSSPTFNPAVSGFCGDGVLGLEEACDTKIQSEDTTDTTQSLGCSSQCLHIGTSIASEWCENGENKANGYTTAEEIAAVCNTSKSVCGNGVLENGEQCEREGANAVSDTYCSPSCRFYDGDTSDNDTEGGQIGICGTDYEQCEAGTEGCSVYCTFAGSSLLYSTPSLCGDGKDGIGEEKTASGDMVCEVDGGGEEPVTELPLQIATAIGEGEVTTGTQKTNIEVTMPLESKNGVPVVGVADYTLQCGFTEFDELQNGLYNDCVIPQDDDTSENGLGVGYNSCCYPRPVRTEEYPVDGAGLGNEEPVCRNTYIEVTFDVPVVPASIAGSALIARGYETFQNCAAVGGENVTAEVSEALGLAGGVAVAEEPTGFWKKMWSGIKHWFKKLLGGDVFAQQVQLKNIKTWCTTDVVLSTNLYQPSTTVPLYISNVLGESHAHTAYAVLLRGEKGGIQDIHGVGIKHPTKAITHDAWAFEVGAEICKIDDVLVDPSSHLFMQPSTSTDFGADASSKKGQLIVSTPPYSWEWAWNPQTSGIFDIPVEGHPADSQFTKLGSTNVEGSLLAVAQTIITNDVSTENNHTGKIFEGETHLTSMFCEHPWPALSGNEWLPYTDEEYNFSFSYCADAGLSGIFEDDLPFVEDKSINVVSGGACSVTLNSCGVASECENVFEFYNRTYAGSPDKDGLCEFPYQNSIWEPIEEVKNGIHFVFGCNEDVECQDPSQYIDESTGAYYTDLLLSVDVSTLDLSSNIASATCNTSRPIIKQQCEGSVVGALNRELFVNDTNSDALGLQIFENPNRLSAADWFNDKFPTAATPQQIEIAGYDAVADQDNYYVNAFNIEKDDNTGAVTQVYSNIYLFSISQGAGESTRNVFQQILDSLEFNTNLTDHGYCIGYDGVTPDYENACSTDFDCVLGLIDVVSTEEKIGVCAGTEDGNWKATNTGDITKDIYVVDAVSQDVVWAGGLLGLVVRSENGGETWDQVTEVTNTRIDDLIALTELRALVISNDVLYETVDRGVSWNTISGDVNVFGNSFQVSNMAFWNDEIGILIGIEEDQSNKRLYNTTDGGKTWILVNDNNVPYPITDVTFLSANTVMAVGDKGKILRSEDGGVSWGGIQAGTATNLQTIEFFNNIGWIAGESGTILYSNDYGVTWTQNSKGLVSESIQDIGIPSSNEAWMAAGTKILHTKNSGATWIVEDMLDGVESKGVTFVGSKGWMAGTNGTMLTIGDAPQQCIFDTECTDGNECIGSVENKVETYKSAGCHAEKTKLARDWERLQDVQSMQLALQSTALPQLNEGTFKKNYVSSVWPSWGSFGNTVGQNLPQDAINTWDGCDPADPQTCWNSDESTFICPQYASVYEYEYDEALASYALHVPMEFFKDEQFVEDQFSAPKMNPEINTPFILDTEAFTIDRGCVAGQAYGFTTSQCGDGVVGPGEQCDPVGKSTLAKQGAAVETYGECENNNSVSCLYDADCEYTLRSEDEEEIYSFVPSSQPFCVVQPEQGNLQIIIDKTNSSGSNKVLFPCSDTSECQNIDTYDTTEVRVVDVETDGSNIIGVFSQSEFEAFIDENKASMLCIPQEQIIAESCIGAVLEGAIVQCDSEPIQEFATNVCNAECQWNYGACEPLYECGNGIVDTGEACDDGVLNGKYGQCAGNDVSVTENIATDQSCLGDEDCNDGNACNIDRCLGQVCIYSSEIVEDCVAANACQELHYQSCGNEIIDYDSSGNALEFCDLGIDGVSTYNLEKENSCRWDCQGYGSYCGDGVIDFVEGEECDGENADICTNECKLVSYACFNAIKDTVAYVPFDPNDNVFSSQDDVLVNMSVGNGTTVIEILYGTDQELYIPECVGLTGDEICKQFGLQCTDVTESDLFLNLIANETSLSDQACEETLVTQDTPEDMVVSVYCDGEYNQDIPEESEPEIVASCGNGILDEGEQCDPTEPGTKTFADCANLGYGDPSCVYCSSQCTIKTKEPDLYCGNGIVDQISPGVYEACDVGIEEDAAGLVYKGFGDGQYSGAMCSYLPEKNDLGQVVPGMSYEYGEVACNNNCTEFDASACFTCGLSDEINGAIPRVSFLNTMAASNIPISAKLFVDNKSGTSNIGKIAYITQDIAVENIDILNKESSSEQISIVAENQCTPVCVNGVCEDGYFLSLASVDYNDSNLIHHFEYPVTENGVPVIKNEYVVSPSVATGTIRVVIRWTGAEESAGGDFRGYFLNTSFESQLTGYDSAASEECINVENDPDTHSYIPVECPLLEGGVYIHPEVGIANTIVQATTLNIDEFTGKDSVTGFLVRQLDDTIHAWKNESISVDIYTYHENQKMGFYYPPTYTFNIGDAADTSTSVDSLYWYPFNIIPDLNLLDDEKKTTAQPIPGSEMWIVPVDVIRLNDCWALDQMYTGFVPQGVCD